MELQKSAVVSSRDKRTKELLNSEADLIERLRTKEELYAHDKHQADEAFNQTTKSDQSIDQDNQITGNVDYHIDNFPKDNQFHRTVTNGNKPTTFHRTPIVTNQAFNTDYNITAETRNNKATVHEAITTDNTIIKQVDMASGSTNTASLLVLTIRKVAKSPPHEAILIWNDEPELTDCYYQLELNGCICGDKLPTDVSSVSITLQPGLLHCLNLNLMRSSDGNNSSFLIRKSEPLYMFIPKLSSAPQLSETSINVLNSVAVLVNKDFNFEDLLPPLLLSDNLTSSSSCCTLLSVYSLVLAFTCNGKLLENVEISSEHIKSLSKPGSCQISIECYIRGCLPKKIYGIQCCLSLEAKPLNSAVFLPSITSKTSNMIEITCPSPPEANCPSIKGCSYEGIHIEWDKASVYGAATLTGYQLVINGQRCVDIIPPNLTNTVFKHCELNMFYQFRIVAFTQHICGSCNKSADSGKGPFSIHLVSTQKDIWSGPITYNCCLPSEGAAIRYSGFVLPVKEVCLQAIFSKSATACWEVVPVADVAATHFLVKLDCLDMNDNSASYVETMHLNKYDYTYQLSNLEPDANYALSIEAAVGLDATKIGSIAKSNSVHFSTLPLPTSPHNLKICSQLESLLVTWESRNSLVAGFFVRIKERDSHQSNKRVLLPRDCCCCAITHLKCDICYEVSISTAYHETDSFNDNLSSTDSVTSYGTPLGPTSSTINLLQASVENAHYVHIQWKLPNIAANECFHHSSVLCWEGSNTDYHADDLLNCINSEIFDSFVLKKELPHNIVSLSIPDLLPGRVYSCAVVHTLVNNTHYCVSWDEVNMPTVRAWEEETTVTSTHSHCVLSNVVTVVMPVPSLTPRLLLCGIGPEITLMWISPCDSLYDTNVVMLGYLLNVNGNEQHFNCHTNKHVVLNCKPEIEYYITLQAETKNQLDEFGVSQPDKLCVKLPAVTESGFHMISCNYVMVNDAGDKPVKLLAISWDFKVFTEKLSVTSYVMEWMSSLSANLVRITLNSSSRGYDITDPQTRAVYEITVTVVLSDGSRIKSAALSYQIPSSPDTLTISVDVVKHNYFIVSWLEPQQHGGCSVIGYQAFLDGKKIGNVIDDTCLSARIPRRRHM